MIKQNLNKKDIISLLNSDNKELFKTADSIRKQYKGDYVHLRGLIEFSNICKCNCFYCGLRCDNNKIDRYRLSFEQILECVDIGVKNGLKTIVLQSGEDFFWNHNKLCELIKEIKEYDVALTLSIGERSYDEYKAFKKAGADRYLLRIETTDKNLYQKFHPNMSFENRIQCLKNLKELGYETGTGCLVGLPNQSIESLADDILFFKSINADMVGIGPFIPHPETPLANANKNNFNLSLKVMAITRIILPDINIPATTAMETLHPEGRMIALNSGANVVMPNITLDEAKQKYELYPNKTCINETSDNCINSIKKKIISSGKIISNSKGFRTGIN